MRFACRTMIALKAASYLVKATQGQGQGPSRQGKDSGLELGVPGLHCGHNVGHGSGKG